MKKYLIYKHTSPSSKSYIGQTKQYKRRCYEHQYYNGCIAFKNAIKKYG
jgi:predicted GIY-YIG superfamily endonuclease